MENATGTEPIKESQQNLPWRCQGNGRTVGGTVVGWIEHDLPEPLRTKVRQADAAQNRPRTAKAHNLQAGVGEVELKQPLDLPPEIKGKEALDDTLSEEQVKGFGAGEKDQERNPSDSRRVPGQAQPVQIRPARPSFQIRPTTDEQKLNKTERAFLEFLRSRDTGWIGVQNVTLKIGDDCRYTPDFLVITQGWEPPVVFYECKGFWRDDARVKIKVAARQFPWAKFIAVQRIKGQWRFEEIKP